MSGKIHANYIKKQLLNVFVWNKEMKTTIAQYQMKYDVL